MRPITSRRASSFRQSVSRNPLNSVLLRSFLFAGLSLAAILHPFAPAAHAQRGQGTEFGLEDDFIVLGDTGTWSDPDVEIKGFTVFGNNLIGPQLVTPSTGTVVIRGNLQVDSTSYFGSSVTIFGQAQPWSLSVSSNAYFGGNVGIGTTAPARMLDITGTDAIIDLNSTGSGGHRWSIISNSAGYTALPGGLSFLYDNSTWVMNLTNNNVGIGTTNPGYKLDVNGTANISGALTAGTFAPASLSVPGYAHLAHASGNVGIGTTAPGAMLQVATAAYTAGTVVFQVGGGTLTALTNGNVGIGTTNPAAKLHVQDSADAGQGFIRATNFNPIPSAQWPTFDGTAPYLLQYALWVGWDDTNKAWKYYRDASNTRGLTDPGNPSGWAINGAGIGYFDGNLDILPSGTHTNNKYDPRAMAARCGQDDIQVKVGSVWVDKYAVRIIDVDSNYSGNTLKDDAVDCSVPGNVPMCSGQEFSPYWMAFSQKLRASTGMTWFMAVAAAANTGKQMLTNADWQTAAAGTAQGTGNSQTNGRDWSAAVPDAELSRYGVVGMAGNLWEWVLDWGEYGEYSHPTLIKGDRKAWNKNKTTGLYEGLPSDWYYDNWDEYVWPEGYGDRQDSVAFAGGPVWDSVSWGSHGAPSALMRGGNWSSGTSAGIFAVGTMYSPVVWYTWVGFRSGSRK